MTPQEFVLTIYLQKSSAWNSAAEDLANRALADAKAKDNKGQLAIMLAGLLSGGIGGAVKGGVVGGVLGAPIGALVAEEGKRGTGALKGLGIGAGTGAVLGGGIGAATGGMYGYAVAPKIMQGLREAAAAREAERFK